MNLLRGLTAAVIASVGGFAIYAILMWSKFGVQSLDNLPRVLCYVPELCAVLTALFGLAAILEFTPSRRLSIAIAFVQVSGLAFLGLVVMIIAPIVFELDPVSKTSAPYLFLRISIVLAVMVAGTGLLTWRRVRSIQDRAI